MNEELRDEYLDEVAATVRSVIEYAAGMIGSDDLVRRYGDVWEPALRLRQALVTDENRADFVAVVADLASILAHSLLVTLDGGTALSDDGKKVFLTDQSGDEIADVLHERLFDHLDIEDALRAATR